MFQRPTTREMYRVGSAWARSLGLDPYISLLAQHDWVHAHFGLGVTDEGIVFAIEECLEANLLVDFWYFAGMTVEHAPAGDTFNFEAIERAHRQLTAMWAS